ncbi:L,D-transpeptidase family protein [Flavobacterium capsici]|uniref:L,D-transpeptidase family protein n=1 Tax=Flavobacterium capsici TaxID=3075618 RepID=A0AA96F4Z9_9FLAO|nr:MULTISPECIES: L,D-transpeptidase family protein [unclassified Flavobacterium]WNM18759.1 L,D-transpeptidase family protein [Flavobacterium sp. PMR2A8]WNM22810.1 L,D-transpeptidase family protein [Flavobacterium sp. PMTSA4]
MNFKMIIPTVLLILLFAVLLNKNKIINAFSKTKKEETIESVIKKTKKRTEKSLKECLEKNNFDAENIEIAILAFKTEQILELYGRAPKNKDWKLIKTYNFTNFSGVLGPKLKNGDKQIPEGVYQMEYLNPNSKYHLSIKVNYPNSFDREKAKLDGRTDLGGDIMIHGKDVTIGCIPIGDKNIEEVFYLATKAKNKNFPILIAPNDFRKNNNFPSISNISWEKELYLKVEEKLKEFN